METLFTSPYLLVGLGLTATTVVYLLYRSVTVTSKSVIKSRVALPLVNRCCRWLLSPYTLLYSHGIKGPRPLPIVGNILSINKVTFTQNVLSS